MIKFIKGDLLISEADALVNAVNTVGVMGKGIALQFKEAFPINYKLYVEACQKKTLYPGNLLAVWDNNLISGRKLIINFPTKIHWKQPSKYEFIKSGLIALVELLKESQVDSIALPPLGCGNGGLQWPVVKKLIIQYLSELPIGILVYEPHSAIKD